MKPNSHSYTVSQAERIYSLVLCLYPKAHRQTFGPLMLQAFRDSYNDVKTTEGHVGVRFWMGVIEDELRSIVRERVSALRGGVDMRSYIYGLVLGLFLMVNIVWTTVLFPTFESDDEYTGTYLLIYGLVFLFFVVSGLLASRKSKRIEDGLRVGAITALITIVIVTLTFLVVDNVFLDIVSKQPDKIYGFAHSGFSTMRDYINSGFLRGLFTVIPAFGVIGAVCGAIGASVWKFIIRTTPTAEAN